MRRLDKTGTLLPPWILLVLSAAVPAEMGLVRSIVAAEADVAAAEDPAAGVAEPADNQEGPRELRFTFRYTPWEDVLEWLAEESELALSKDVVPTGTFNYWDPNRKFTLHEAMDVINRHLLVNGYTLVRNEQTLLVLDYENEIDRQLLRELLTETPLDELDKRGDFEMTKTTFVLDHMDATEAEKQVNQLLTPPFGHLVVMPGANQILATDTGRTLRKIRAIFGGLEETAEAEDKDNVHVFRLRTANAIEVLSAVRPLVKLDDDENAAEDGSIRISANPGGNTVFAAGTPENIKIVKQVVESMDSGGADDPYGDEQPQFIAHRLQAAQPDAVLRVLQTLLQDDPTVRLEIDSSGGGIMALARPSQHAMIRATIAQMEQHSDRLVVLPLQVNDPADVMMVVGNLFATSQTPPIVSGTVDPPQLIVRGSDAQIEKIRELLESMGERWGRSALAATARGNVRMFQMDPDQARVLLDRIEQIWPRLSDYPVHVVRPEGQSSSIRTLRPESAVIEGSLRRPAQAGPSRAGGEPGPNVEGVGEASSGREAESSDTTDRTTAVGAGAASRPATAGFRVLAVSDQGAGEGSVGGPARDLAEPGDDSIDLTEPNAGEPPATDQWDREQGRPAGITIVPTPGGLMVTSEDEEALGSIESLIEMFAGQSEGGGPRFHLFYLKHIGAEEASQLLTSLLTGTSTATTATAGRSYGVIGGTASPTFTGLAGSPITASAPTIVADKRLNSLFVQGTSAQVRLIDQLLQVIDIESGPEEVLTFPRPHFIPVYNTSAEEVVAVLEKLYVHRIETGANNRNRGGGGDDDRRGRGGFGRFFGRGDDDDNRGGNVRQDVAGDLAKMTLAADTTSNSVVVSAPGPLVQEVEMVVRDIDSRAAQTPPPTVEVISLKYANSGYIKDALVNALGDMAQTSQSTTSGRRTDNSRDTNRGISSDDARAEFFRRGGFGRGDFGRGRFGGGDDDGRDRGRGGDDDDRGGRGR